MQILLINANPIISRLFLRNTSHLDAIEIDEVSAVDDIPRKSYDVLFIDEECYEGRDIDREISKIDAAKKILFSTKQESVYRDIDMVIVKPFLPSSIIKVLNSILPNGKKISKERVDILAPEEISSSGEDAANSGSAVLDGDEIEIIKQLLLDEGLEVNDDEEDEIVFDEAPKKKDIEKKGSKKKKKRSKQKFDAELLEYLMKMKPKKIKRLLEGAKVNITIDFPKES